VVFVAHEASQVDLLRRADAAMYLAKEAGRNAIRFAGVPSTNAPQGAANPPVATDASSTHDTPAGRHPSSSS
jgi:hypothetical protein